MAHGTVHELDLKSHLTFIQKLRSVVTVLTDHGLEHPMSFVPALYSATYSPSYHFGFKPSGIATLLVKWRAMGASWTFKILHRGSVTWPWLNECWPYRSLSRPLKLRKRGSINKKRKERNLVNPGIKHTCRSIPTSRRLC